MKICDFTVPELEFCKEFCNFSDLEELLFTLRSNGHTLEECCEPMNMELSSVKRISQKVNRKIVYVSSRINFDKWVKEKFS